MIPIICDGCGQKITTKYLYRVDYEDGYCDFCSNKCARKHITKNMDDLIFLINQ